LVLNFIEEKEEERMAEEECGREEKISIGTQHLLTSPLLYWTLLLAFPFFSSYKQCLQKYSL